MQIDAKKGGFITDFPLNELFWLDSLKAKKPRTFVQDFLLCGKGIILASLAGNFFLLIQASLIRSKQKSPAI
jgi:hypothetical protein